MSRLAEAETRFADAIKALEAAIESRLAAAATALPVVLEKGS